AWGGCRGVRGPANGRAAGEGRPATRERCPQSDRRGSVRDEQAQADGGGRDESRVRDGPRPEPPGEDTGRRLAIRWVEPCVLLLERGAARSQRAERGAGRSLWHAHRVPEDGR